MRLPLWASLAALPAFPAAPIASGARFQLVAEIWINQAGGGQSSTYTAHAYDGEGRRIRTEIFPGLDGSGEVFEVRELAYRSDGLLEAQATYRGNDLESRVLFRYDAWGRPSEKVVVGADGSERFREAFAYDPEGRLRAETRLKGESPTSMRRLAYAADGSVLSDSLFEPEGAGLVPVQAILHGTGRAPEEKRESRWRKQDGAWYHVMDTFRLHGKGLLLYAASYQVGGRRLDSAAFAHDAYGNRVLEERFDGRGLPLSRLVFQWKDLQAVSIRRRAAFRGGTARDPVPRLGGSAGAGWNRDGLDLLGRLRRQVSAAPGRQE